MLGACTVEAWLGEFEHYFASIWNTCNCVVVWTFFDIALLWDWNENWPFPVLWSMLSFPYLLAYWVQHFNLLCILLDIQWFHVFISLLFPFNKIMLFLNYSPCQELQPSSFMLIDFNALLLNYKMKKLVICWYLVFLIWYSYISSGSIHFIPKWHICLETAAKNQDIIIRHNYVWVICTVESQCLWDI